MFPETCQWCDHIRIDDRHGVTSVIPYTLPLRCYTITDWKNGYYCYLTGNKIEYGDTCPKWEIMDYAF